MASPFLRVVPAACAVLHASGAGSRRLPPSSGGLSRFLLCASGERGPEYNRRFLNRHSVSLNAAAFRDFFTRCLLRVFFTCRAHKSAGPD